MDAINQRLTSSKCILMTFVFLLLNIGIFNSCYASATQVLFLGNSYTSVNNLPLMFANLAHAGGHDVAIRMVAQGGWTFANMVSSQEIVTQLKTVQWNYVILQEQSQIPSVEHYRQEQMYPAARVLIHAIREAGATPMLFLPWTHRRGWPENGLKNYESMQSAIAEGYIALAKEQSIAVVPVGYAWYAVWQSHPEIELWSGDGIHPSVAGTYLAACVFYVAIFRQSPEGLTYTAGLPSNVAQILQKAAMTTVMGAQWNLPEITTPSTN